MIIKMIEFKSIEGKKFSKGYEKVGNIKIDHSSSIILLNDISESEVSVDFRFTSTFGNLGVINIEGNLIMSDCDAKKITKEWKSTSQIPADIVQDLHGTILANCLTEVVLLARDLHLPPPIPIPQMGTKPNKLQEKQNYGAEVG